MLATSFCASGCSRECSAATSVSTSEFFASWRFLGLQPFSKIGGEDVATVREVGGNTNDGPVGEGMVVIDHSHVRLQRWSHGRGTFRGLGEDDEAMAREDIILLLRGEIEWSHFAQGNGGVEESPHAPAGCIGLLQQVDQRRRGSRIGRLGMLRHPVAGLHHSLGVLAFELREHLFFILQFPALLTRVRSFPPGASVTLSAG